MKCEKYVKSIRNSDKKAYARSYLKWIKDGRKGDSPDYPKSLSCMAAQAVRMNLEDESE